ncbi:MAG: excinuclease ABC subunit UvrC [Xanthomonadales bacterium]|nr:UvrABC system protein C [Xanthomonadales bacterium]MCC6593058.1 excinuclease ABC subunit UvrC [Xanthomonadales bacterium]MCE7930362.1 excinuclease ABC subunit UvrC [Xanthomonadales bacterium PRO6]
MSAAAAADVFDGRAFARTLSGKPGVYRMLGDEGQVLYVGKARSLRARVESYFARGAQAARIAAMLMQVRRIEVIVTRTEAEALLLEGQLIKALKPRYNIELRDDKSYPWIRLTAADEYPRVAFHRGARSPSDRYFGPYPSASAVRETLNMVHKAFGLRQCEDSVFAHRTRPCLQHQIGRCSAPCVGLVDPHEYADSVRHASLLLEGRSSLLVDELSAEMDAAARALEFERAARLRDRIATLRRVLATQFVQGERGDLDVLACVSRHGKACVESLFFRGGLSLGNRSWFPRFIGEADPAEVLRAFVLQHYASQPAPAELLLSHPIEDQDLVAEVLAARAGRRVALIDKPRGERARWVEMALRTAESALGSEIAAHATVGERRESLRALFGLAEAPARIECYDISHTQGERAVASCVVFGPEGAVKSEYRRFNIDGIAAGDDYAAMRQVLTRRFARLARGESARPDLLLIDGGWGQLRQALEVLGELGVGDLMVVGVAKGPERRPGEETLVLADRRELRPGPDSSALHLIQQVRDEAHRFAIGGHRARRGKARTRSQLEEIAGVGGKRKSALLKAFGGLQGIRAAAVEDLMSVAGIDRALAQRIHDHFHDH